MDIARHCALCDNQKVGFKEGTTCRLTDRKPEFNLTCSEIALNEKFENKLKAINVEYEKIKRTKTFTYIYFGIFILIGFAVIVSGYALGKYVFDIGVISTVPLLIMVVGLAPLGMAIGVLNKYKRVFQIAKQEKDNIDEILKVYNIEYEIKISFGKEFHGSQEVFSELKIKS